jgi:hypothetical protein
MKFRQIVSSLLVVCLTGLGLPLPVHAGMISTDAVAMAGASAGDRDRIAGMLERTDVQAQLQAYGVKAADVKARVAAMTDEEAAKLTAQIDTLPAGGLIEAIIFVFLVLLITDILGFTKIFPFTRSVR